MDEPLDFDNAVRARAPARDSPRFLAGARAPTRRPNKLATLFSVKVPEGAKWP